MQSLRCLRTFGFYVHRARFGAEKVKVIGKFCHSFTEIVINSWQSVSSDSNEFPTLKNAVLRHTNHLRLLGVYFILLNRKPPVKIGIKSWLKITLQLSFHRFSCFRSESALLVLWINVERRTKSSSSPSSPHYWYAAAFLQYYVDIYYISIVSRNTHKA